MKRPILFYLYRICCRRKRQEGFLQRACGRRHGVQMEIFYYGKTVGETRVMFGTYLNREKIHGFKPVKITGIEPHRSCNLVPFWKGEFWHV
jgi:hypothetical protein